MYRRILFLTSLTLLGGCELQDERSLFEARGPQPGTRTQALSAPAPLGSLKTVAPPRPSNWSAFVSNTPAAVRLGKSLFWDLQVSSDGKVACASCHFHAGADARFKNQIRPVGGSFFHGGANHTLSPADYPFHKLANWDDPASTVLSDTANRTVSQGVMLHDFIDIVPGSAQERGAVVPDPVFSIGGVNVRRAAAANAPTVINAVYNFRQLVVGFPQDVFNGVNPFGERDTSARVYRHQSGRLEPVQVRLENASLASQAVDPPLNSSEMSYRGRTFPKLCKKLFSLKPLGGQQVAPDDGVLGSLADPSGRGLATDYPALIKEAFQAEWWNGPHVLKGGPNGLEPTTLTGRPSGTDEYSLMEANCSLFWGLALQAYVSTLVANDSHFDRVMEGRATFTHEQEQGHRIFTGQPDVHGRSANCATCHSGPELTSQSVANVLRERVERIRMLDGGTSLIDVGFRNIGSRRVWDLPGLATDLPGFGPLSLARYAQLGGDIHFTAEPPIAPGERTSAVEAAYKVPHLRNIELTGPYMHSGGFATLRQVVDFFNRGGDFAVENRDSFDPAIHRLNLTPQERCWLVEFLRTLTDERVRHRRAPFDHPQLFVVHGHPGTTAAVQSDGSGRAVDLVQEIPSVGASGTAALAPYLGLDPHLGNQPGQGSIQDCY